MLYKLSPEYALRRWKNTDTVLMNLKTRQITGLDMFSFITLNQCDGVTECEPGDTYIKFFAERGVIVPSEDGGEITQEQRYREYANEYFPIAQWAVTNRCNYPCKHCFMAASAKHETAEPTFEQCLDIIRQIDECGIKHIYLTGGEPLLRKDFLSLLDELTRRDIHIDIISTNGALVNETLLLEIKSRGIRTAFAVSFDGMGRHDWLRGVEGAEEASINAVKLIKAHGFPVIMEMAVHKGNVDITIETAEMAYSLGIDTFKTIRVAESPRWKELGGDNGLTPQAYYDASLGLLKAHIERNWQMDMKLIGFIYRYHKNGRCDILPMKGLPTDSDNTVLCKKARSILFISGDGRLLPCNPFAGATSGREDWGNVFEQPLAELLTQSPYLDKVNARVRMIKEHDEKCRACQWLKYCLGGCRACAYAATYDYLAADPTKCAFFEGGYVEKIREIAGADCCTADF